MKILLIKMAPRIGGAEIYNINLIRGLKKFYPEIEIWLITNLTEFGKKIEALGAKTFILPVFDEEVGTKRGLVKLIFALPKYLFYNLSTILFLRIKEGVKLVVLQGATEKIILTPLFKVLKFRIIWLEHGPFFAFKKTKIILFLYKLNSYFADKIITVSENAREDLIKGEINKEKVICIHSGIDTDCFRREPAGTRNLVIGYAGTICHEKGIEDFFKASEIIRRHIKELKFVLVGKGPMLKKRKNFVFTGFKEDIRLYLGKFSVFFFPTWHLEGLSLVLMEAMAMGIPVVARDIGGNRELVVHGKTGYLFKNESNEEVAEMIIKLLKDRKKREKMGKLARVRIVKYFDLERWTREMQAAFESCLENDLKN